MKKAYVCGVMVICIFLVVLVAYPSEAALYGEFAFGRTPISRHPLKPKTKDEVMDAIRYVDKRDGISELEAKIIAQHEIIKKNLDHTYDLSKPKIVEENEDEWIIRIPAKFSVSANRVPNRYLICIDKRTGDLICSKVDTVP